MPLGDEKHKLIYQELVNILGADYVEDDPVVMEAFSRDALAPSLLTRGRFEFIVLPENTEDVQQIMRLANRYEFPVSVSASGLAMSTCGAVEGYPYWCFIDPKRMNRIIEIDGDNMYAIIEPAITIAQLQAEAMKKGLFCGVTGASTTSSALSTNMFQSIHWTGWRTGVGCNVLGVEWVLPGGDILRTGSLAMPGGEWCWGEGPGPDARGLLRGHVSHLGSLGVTTKMAVKLYPWPGPPVWPTDGVQPEKKSVLPPEKIKSYFLNFPSLEKSIDAIREMGKAEIGGYVMKYAPWDFVCWYTKSFEEFWQEWESEYWMKQKKSGSLVAIGLWAFASEKQVKYEEKVLKQIIQEYEGELVPDEIYKKMDAVVTPCTVRDTYRHRFTKLGRVDVVGATMDSLYDVLRSAKVDMVTKEKYTPPLGYMGNDMKFWPFHFGRLTWTEFDCAAEKSPEFEDMLLQRMATDFMKEIVDNQSAPTSTAGMLHLTGHLYNNVHLFFAKIKKALDPNNIANPTRTIDMEAMEKGEAPDETKAVF